MAPFCSCPASLVSGIFFAVGPGCAKCFFWLRSVGRRDLSAGPEQKNNTTQGVFFLAAAPGKGTGLLLPLPFPGAGAKKKTPWVVLFVFAAAPRGRSLTHCGPGWRCLPLAGVVFVFFLLRPRPDRGGVLVFALAPPGLSLTHCGLGRFRQGPGGVCFCAAAPPGLFRQ